MSKGYVTNLVMKSELYNLNSITTDATLENKFQICLTKLSNNSTKEIGLKEIRSLIANSVGNSKALRHYISSLKLSPKGNSLSNNALENQVIVYGILAEEFMQNLYDPLDKPANLIKSIARVLMQLREGYLKYNNNIQKLVADSYIKFLLYCMPKDDESLIIIVFFDPLINLISSGTTINVQQGSAYVLMRLIEYIGQKKINSLSDMHLLEIISEKCIQNLLKAPPLDNFYIIECIYQIMLYIKFDFFFPFLKELYDKLILYLNHNEFNYQIKISILKVLNLIATKLINMSKYSFSNNKAIGYFQSEIIDAINIKLSDRIHKVQLEARNAMKNWRILEEIFYKEERKKENILLENEDLLDSLENNENIEGNDIKNNNKISDKEKKIKKIINKNKPSNFKQRYKEFSAQKNIEENKDNNILIDTVKLNSQELNNKVNNDISEINELENNSTLNNNGTIDSNNLCKILKMTLKNVIETECTNIQSQFYDAISNRLNILENRVNKLTKKVNKVKILKNNNNKNDTNFSEENSSNLMVINNNKINNENKENDIESESSKKWLKCIKLLEKNYIKDSYELILNTKDDIYLLRLICLTGPCLYLLNEDTALKVLIRMNMIHRGKQIQDVLINLIDESLKIGIFDKLEYNQKNDILDSLFFIFHNNEKDPIAFKAKNLYKKIIELNK